MSRSVPTDRGTRVVPGCGIPSARGGCSWSSCTPPVPFEGFDFRTSADVKFKEILLDAYYERGSSADKRPTMVTAGLTVSDQQTILYDDVVVAEERIGCRPPCASGRARRTVRSLPCSLPERPSQGRPAAHRGEHQPA